MAYILGSPKLWQHMHPLFSKASKVGAGSGTYLASLVRQGVLDRYGLDRCRM